MSDPVAPPISAIATDADGRLLLTPEEARALLRECGGEFFSAVADLVAFSVEGTNDLFEHNLQITAAEVSEFRKKRPEWIKRFAQTQKELFEMRLTGQRRQGRRVDADGSVASLRLLSDFEQEKQTALTTATEILHQLTKREVAALELRVGVLLGETLTREIDNPFAPDYILDAIGMTSRALLANRLWRPLMERVIADIAPGTAKAYIRLNRVLAERNVLPEIKAELRARSDLRPDDDAELLPLFGKLINEVAPSTLRLDGVAPAALAGGGERPPFGGVIAAVAPALPHAINPYAIDLARVPPPHAATGAPASASGLPQLEPMLALGSLSAVVAALQRWQVLDPSAGASTPVGSGAGATALSPLNRIPLIRAAIADKLGNPSDKTTIDVIALLFEYISRDPSIPEPLRSLFGRLQVPTLKAALIDRTFFSDKKHPARRLLDHLAAAAIGATGDEAYRTGFERVAAGGIDAVCRYFKVDVVIFAAADAKLQEFVAAEQRQAAALIERDVQAALVAETADADRSQVRALIRDKLIGVNVPFEVRGFAETIWVNYLTQLRQRHGAESEAWSNGVKTLDDLLWSITAKERSAQKAHLTKMVPSLIRSLRSGGIEVQVRDDRLQHFLDAVYKLHMAAIKPMADHGAAAPAAEMLHVPTLRTVVNVYDFVAEMVVGTWLSFDEKGRVSNARLSWMSPLRTQYIFTTRARGRTLAVSPEELAWQLREGSARLIVEPVPLFDRAVSSALDELAASRPGQEAAA